MTSGTRKPRGGVLEALLGYQIRRASAEIMLTLAEDLAPLALTVVEASVLVAIVEVPGSTQSDLGRRLDIHRANMVPLAAKLEERRLVGRRQGPGRSAQLFATADGQRVAGKALHILRAHDERYLGEIGPRDRERLRGWLRHMWSP